MIRLAAGHGAHNVRVFGSVVRGDSTTEGDVDFIVDLDLVWNVVRLELPGLAGAVDDLLSRNPE